VNLMDMRPKYKMRFVGYDANGELKPTAPAYKQHEIRELPLEYAQNFWWELVDAVPDLVIPEPRYEDSVFIEEVFVPPDDEAPAPPLEDEDKPLSLKEESDPNLAEDEEWDTSEFITSHSDNLGAMPTSEAVEPSEASEVFTHHSGGLGDIVTMKVEPSLELGEAFVVAPDVFDDRGEVDPSKVVKIEGLDVSEAIDETLALLTLGKMTVKELKTLIKQRGGEVDSSWRKADLIREARKLEEFSSPT